MNDPHILPQPVETKAYTDTNGTVYEHQGQAMAANARIALENLYDDNSAHNEMTFQGLIEMIEENRELMTEIVSFLGKIKK